MRYNWHRIADNGPLPVRFEHSLVYIKDETTDLSKVYAVGRREGGDEEEVYELDVKSAHWNLLTSSYDTEVTRKAVAAKRRGAVLAGVGASVYVLGGVPASCGSVLKFDTIQQKWCMRNVTGASVDLSLVTAAAVVGERVVLFNSNNSVNLYDSVKSQWISAKIFGGPPALNSVSIAATLGKERILVHDGRLDSDLWCFEVGSAKLQAQKRSGSEEVVAAWSKCRRDTIPVVICGPSGVGKGTLIAMLMKEFPDMFGFSVSHTTRKPREKEVDGVHYHFTTREAMEAAVSEGKFLEHANVHGNLYGTSIAAVEAVSLAGKRCILDIDVQGAKSVRKSSMLALFIFITPPSFEELERRLRGRGTETEEQVSRRLQTAKRELQLAEEELLFDHTLVNDNLESTYKQLKAILGLADNAAQSPAALKLMTMRSGKGPAEVQLVDTSAMTGGPPEAYVEGVKRLRLEPTEKPIPCEFTQAVQLSELEILMTSTDGGTVVVRVGK